MNKIIDFFFITILLCTLSEITSFVIKGTFIGSILGLVDELFVLCIFVYSLTKERKTSNVFTILLLLFTISGIIGNVLHKTDTIVCIQGTFNTVKPLLLYYAFSRFDFEWCDFFRFCNHMEKLFLVICIGYILDIITPAFRQSIGYSQLDIRAGIRTIGGPFYKQTNGILFMLFYYVYYKYYNFSNWRYIFSASMIALALKIKDVFAFFIAFLTGLFRNIRVSVIIIIMPLVFLLYFLYMTFMPLHYSQYFESGDDSNVARVVLTSTSFKIAFDEFPFGMGFGQYGSPISRIYQSPVYSQYGIDTVYGLSFNEDSRNFMVDTFWPMIIGETGWLGTILFICLIFSAFAPFLSGYIKDTKDLRYVFPSFLFIVMLITTVGKPVLVGPPHSFMLWGIAGIFNSLINKEYSN